MPTASRLSLWERRETRRVNNGAGAVAAMFSWFYRSGISAGLTHRLREGIISESRDHVHLPVSVKQNTDTHFSFMTPDKIQRRDKGMQPFTDMSLFQACRLS